MNYLHCQTAAPAIFAHRGYHVHAPENSLAAVKALLELAMQHPHVKVMIELDVRLSNDGAPVIMHDADVSRTTLGSGLVNQMSVNQLKSLPMRLDPSYAGEVTTPEKAQYFPVTPEDYRVPTLTEVMALIKHANERRVALGSPIGLALEIKPRPLGESPVLGYVARGISSVLKQFGLGQVAVSLLPESQTAEALAEFMNREYRSGDLGVPMMVFANGPIGQRDVKHFWDNVNDKAKQGLARFQPMIGANSDTPSPVLQSPERAELIGTAPKNALATKLVSAFSNFWYVGNPATDESVCGVGATPHHALTTSFKPVNDPFLMRRAMDQGMDIIATDRPDQLIKIIQERYGQPSVAQPSPGLHAPHTSRLREQHAQQQAHAALAV